MITVPQLRAAFDAMLKEVLPTLHNTTQTAVHGSIERGHRTDAIGIIATAIAARWTLHKPAAKAYADFWALLAKSGISLSAL